MKSAVARRQNAGCNVKRSGDVSSRKYLCRFGRRENQGGVMIRLHVGAIGLSMLATASVLAADPIEIGVGYIRRPAVKPALSLVEQPAENDGVAGARLAT